MRCRDELVERIISKLAATTDFVRITMATSMFEDPSEVDLSVLTSLPIDVRREVERELAKQKLQQHQRKTKTCGNKQEVAITATSNRKKKKKSPKYWQAEETNDGGVEVLCYDCRRQPQKKRQRTLNFCPVVATKENNTLHQSPRHDESKDAAAIDDGDIFCARCRLPLHIQQPKRNAQQNRVVTVLPQVTRLKGYKRLANDTGVPFALTDSEAMTIMRQPCFGCGKSAGEDGNGISRLRNWDGFSEETKKMAKKGYMGPFSKSNCIGACAVCNLMKGSRSILSFVEACRTIATHRGGGSRDYGKFPNRFRDNVSKRSRSCYITKSSTHTKTHCLTNQQFHDIVSMPCAYCGKEPTETHHNGLDRIDSDNRVYSADNVVSCCGDCNIMKYKHSVEFFIQHCKQVADHNEAEPIEK